jgi:putative ATP-dependent endonuclease of the OLD family
VGKSYGNNRVVNQIMNRILDEAAFDALTFEQVLAMANDYGVFMNDFTFEIDLFNAGAEDEFKEAVEGLTENKKMHKRFSSLASDPSTLDATQLLKDINSLGKGRFAQRLATVLIENNVDVCPPYVKAALDYMKAKLG